MDPNIYTCPSPLFTVPYPGITLGVPNMAKRRILNMQIHTQFIDTKTYLRSNHFGKKNFPGGDNC